MADWMGQSDTRSVLMDPRGAEIGFAWYQEPTGKIWWTFLIGEPGGIFGAPTGAAAYGQ